RAGGRSGAGVFSVPEARTPRRRLLSNGLLARLTIVVFLVAVSPRVALAADAAPATLQVTHDGRKTVTAVEARAPIVVDGTLDDAVWLQAGPGNGFRQAGPHRGQTGTRDPRVPVALERHAPYS